MKDPTWDRLRVPGWYMSVTYSVDMLTGTSTGYSSWISWRIWGETIPNCIDYGATSLSVVLLTLSVPSLGFSYRLSMMRGC